MNYIGLIVILTIVVCVGGGGMYLLFMSGRKKKLQWNARIYQLGEGVKPPIRDKKGNVLSKVSLKDLHPYAVDKIYREEGEHGKIIYRLAMLNLSTDEVKAEHVEIWGRNKKTEEKWVNVLVIGDTATLLRNGYDHETGEVIFNPMPRERIDLIKTEIILKKDRLKNQKSVLEAITPWVVAGMAILGIIALAYVTIGGIKEINKDQSQAAIASTENIKEAAALNRQAIRDMRGLRPLDSINQTGQNENKESPPSIE